MTTLPKTLTVDSHRYLVDSSLGNVPQVWLHKRRGEPAAHYFAGTSLIEGSPRENADYLRQLVRQS